MGQSCFAVQAKAAKNQSDSHPEQLEKDKKAAVNPHLCLLVYGQQDVYFTYTRPDAARIAGMPVIGLVGALVAGQHDLLGVDHDDVVAAVDMGRKGRLLLAAQ